jgi:hypothetical protein
MKKRLADAQTAAKGFRDTFEAQDRAQVIRFSRDASAAKVSDRSAKRNG